MTTSLIIPHVRRQLDRELHTDHYLAQCINSMRDQVDNLIVVENPGIGYGAAVNRGIAQWFSESENIYDVAIISNNDIKLVAGKLEDLVEAAYWGDVACPMISPEPRDNYPRPFFAIARRLVQRLIEQDGYFYDEQFFPGYFEDDDLIKRLQMLPDCDINYVPSVIVYHENGGGTTMKTFGEQESFNINKERFEKKWNIKV